MLCAQPVVACRGGPGKRVHTAVWLLWAPLCVLDTRPFSNVSFANIFSQSVACLFIVLTAFFTEQKFLNSDRVQLTPSPACFSFTLCFWCCVRMARHPGHLVFLLWWLPGGARLCLLCLGVWCVRVPSAQGDRPGSRPTFLHVAVPSPQRRLLRLSLPRRAASAPSSRSASCACEGVFWAPICSVDLLVCVFAPSTRLDDYSFAGSLESRPQLRSPSVCVGRSGSFVSSSSSSFKIFYLLSRQRETDLRIHWLILACALTGIKPKTWAYQYDALTS